MTAYVALLRAVNVGGTGKLGMAELLDLCKQLGFTNARTYIASGNVVFESALPEARIKATLEVSLAALTGKPVGVLVRTAAEMARVLEANPFRHCPANSTVAIFLDQAPAGGALSSVSGQDEEELSLGLREIYVQYGKGMGRSKLRIPAAKDGTARNMNTIAKLAGMAADFSCIHEGRPTECFPVYPRRP